MQIANVTVISLAALASLEESAETTISVLRSTEPDPIEGHIYEMVLAHKSTTEFNVPYSLVIHGTKDEMFLFLAELQDKFIQASSID